MLVVPSALDVVVAEVGSSETGGDEPSGCGLCRKVFLIISSKVLVFLSIFSVELSCLSPFSSLLPPSFLMGMPKTKFYESFRKKKKIKSVLDQISLKIMNFDLIYDNLASKN